MFNCKEHSWSSLEKECPTCFPDTYTATDLVTIKCPDCGKDVYDGHQCRKGLGWITWGELITDPRVTPVQNLTPEVDFSNYTQMAEDCWLFLTDETMPEVATIKKEAFLHEVRAMIESARQHALKSNNHANK